MPRIPSNSKKVSRKSAINQTTISSYFPSQANRPKRVRVNLDERGRNTGIADSYDAQNTAVDEDSDQHNCNVLNGDKTECLKPDDRLNVGSMTVCSLCEPQSDLDSSDVIPPTPPAGRNSSLNITCTGTIRMELDQHNTTLPGVSTSAADQVRADVLATVLPDSNDECRPSCHADTSELQPKETVFDRSAACHVSETFEDEDVTDGELMAAEANTESMIEKLPVRNDNTDFSSKQNASHSSVRRQLIEKNNQWKNVEFYMNKIESVPRGAKIEEILLHWKGNYEKLERHHGYIQWLFPIPERGMNWEAQPLTQQEAEFIGSHKIAQDRMLRAYNMMLDFFGMKLKSDGTGRLQLASNWRERMAHLNRSSHNYLRITRMLKCFGLVGLSRLQAPFVEFLLHEAFSTRILSNSQRSCRQYWIPSVVDEQERLRLFRQLKKISEQH